MVRSDFKNVFMDLWVAVGITRNRLRDLVVDVYLVQANLVFIFLVSTVFFRVNECDIVCSIQLSPLSYEQVRYILACVILSVIGHPHLLV